LKEFKVRFIKSPHNYIQRAVGCGVLVSRRDFIKGLVGGLIVGAVAGAGAVYVAGPGGGRLSLLRLVLGFQPLP